MEDGNNPRKNAVAVPGDNRLPALAANIAAEHQQAQASMQKGLEHALKAGELLVEAKKLVTHGKWLPWLEANCPFPERTAQLYMRVARERGRLS